MNDQTRSTFDQLNIFTVVHSCCGSYGTDWRYLTILQLSIHFNPNLELKNKTASCETLCHQGNARCILLMSNLLFTILSCYGSTHCLMLIVRYGHLSTLYHSCGLACQKRMLKTVPGLGYLCSEDKVGWLWHSLVILHIYSSQFYFPTPQSHYLMVIGTKVDWTLCVMVAGFLVSRGG